MNQLWPSPANSSPLTPLSFLDRAALVYGDCPSLIYNSTTFTWSETRGRCLKAASAISSLGIEPGEVVSVLAPNIPAMYELHFAVPMAGAVLNTINTRLNASTVSVLLRHAESRLVFVDAQSRQLALQAASLFPVACSKPLLVLITDDERVEAADAAARNKDSSNSVSSIHGRSNSNHLFIDDDYESLLSKVVLPAGGPEHDTATAAAASVKSEWDPIVLNYSSGTTSSPKGVVHSHRGTYLMALDSIIDWPLPKQSVYLWTLPMFHANGWSFTWATAAVGATSICLRKPGAAAIYSVIRRHGVTHMCGAPVILNMLSSSFPPDSVQPLRSPVHILTAGAPPPAPILLRTESLGFRVSHGYGLTETGGVVVSCAWKGSWNRLPATERARLKARQGVRTLGLTAVDVIDPVTGKPVQRDGVSRGEIVLRGGSLMLGYLKDPEETSRCMATSELGDGGGGGWFRTGDVGVMHPDGYLEIKDRLKDVIISGGENINSVEVEAALYTNGAVNEAAVVARPDEYWGETPCAFVSLKEGFPEAERPTERELVEHCRERLPHYMAPKTVVLLGVGDELPKTSTGKIQKYLLRQMAAAMGGRIHTTT